MLADHLLVLIHLLLFATVPQKMRIMHFEPPCRPRPLTYCLFCSQLSQFTMSLSTSRCATAHQPAAVSVTTRCMKRSTRRRPPTAQWTAVAAAVTDHDKMHPPHQGLNPTCHGRIVTQAQHRSTEAQAAIMASTRRHNRCLVVVLDRQWSSGLPWCSCRC